MSEETTQQPVTIVSENTEVVSGTEVQEKLILAARVFSDLLKPTFGPKGLDKMMYKTDGSNAVTNDGSKIISELMVKHPAAKMFVAMAESQENSCGDGVTGTLLLSAELLLEAGRLLQKGLHPLTIIEGYNQANKIALETISKQATKGSVEDLRNVAITALTGKGAEGASEHLSDMIVEALQTVDSDCLLYTSPSPRDGLLSRMPSSA